MGSSQSSAALRGIRVLDLTRVRSGPACVRQLADFGADVIQIESPLREGGDDGVGADRASPDFQNLHRNKRSVTIDLKDPRGLALLMRLVETADVLVENFRPGVKERLGFGYEALRRVNPRVILASISGFGQDGPYADRPGFDQIAQGMGGLMSVTGLPGQGPVRAGTAVADLSAGLFAALGILTALVERQTSGEGQWVQASLLMSQIAMMDFQAARYLMKGEVPRQAGNDHPTTMPTSTYETSDGHVNVGALGDRMWRTLCDTLGRADLVERPEFADNAGRARHREALNAELNEAMSKRTTAEWVEVLNAAGVPCGPVYSMDEVFADPQVRHLGAAVTVTHPRLGPVELVGQAAGLSRTPAAVVTTAPERGEHTDAVLAELGVSPSAIAVLRREGVI